MRAHSLQHVPFVGLGSIESWLQRAGYEVTATRFYDSEELPPPAEVDLVVAMGGPMSVNDERQHPWLAAEKRFIRAVVELGLPVLGVCLGAQLIASACGAAVYPNKVKEIGWLPIQGVAPDGDGDAGAEQPATFRFPPFLDSAFRRSWRCSIGMATRSTCRRERSTWRAATGHGTRRSSSARR